MTDLLALAVRISIMYVFTLTLLRLSGKRSVGELSPLDFTIAILVGDMFDDVFWAEIPLVQAAVGITTVIFLHTLLCYIQSKSRRIHALINSTPTSIIRDGRLLETGMRQERIGEGEVIADLRLQGEDGPEDTREAALEPDGYMSLLKHAPARTAQKQDLSRLLELFR